MTVLAHLIVVATSLFLSLSFAASHGEPKAAVTTHHIDNLRTGWNSHESILNTTNVASVKFGVLASRSDLDGRVDAQPLVVPDVWIGGALHDVVYVVTENDTVYALDATTGATILSKSLGTPINSSVAVSCVNNSTVIGINSTPAIDKATYTMYVIAVTNESGSPVYRLHALSLSDLTDRIASRVVAATASLTDSSTYAFNAGVQRQRPALLLSGGKVFAGFGSWCDDFVSLTRGWVLGWNTSDLSLATAFLTNTINPAPFTGAWAMTSIWMSGAGLAADGSGNIYYTTGNSWGDGVNDTYNATNNLSESAVKLSSAGSVLDYFTSYQLLSWDQPNNDVDFGSGGILLFPDQPGATPHLALVAGKSGDWFLLNRDSMGHYTVGGPDNVLQVFGSAGTACWCAPVYYKGPDGISRAATSGGNAVRIYTLATAPAALTLVHTLSTIGGDQDAGFFTSVSSHNTDSGSEIIWAVSRPDSGVPVGPKLYAFDAISGTQLYSAAAGAWSNPQSNSNIVPVVANGKVYVASDGDFYIFGLSP